ncbi:MAG TPA: glycerophosphoryl diester phosphodiesterase membrane domain-containing protein [Sporichthyaceae bacterium]
MAEDPAAESTSPAQPAAPSGAWAGVQPPAWVLPTPAPEPPAPAPSAQTPAAGWGAPPVYPPAPRPGPGYGPPPPPGGPGMSLPPGWVPPSAQPARPGVVPLRPLGIGEILDGAWSTMRRYWQVQLGFAAAVVTVVTVLQAAALYLVLRDTSALGNNSVDTSGDAATQSAQAVATVIGLLAQIVLQGVLTVVMSRAVLGEEITPRAAWTQARPRLWRLVGLSFSVLTLVAAILAVPVLLGLAIGLSTNSDAGWGIGFLGELAAVPCAVLLFVRLGVAAPALVLEKATIGTAIRRSLRLVRGSFWRVLGILLLTQVITQMATGMLALPFLGVGLAVSGTAGHPGVAFYLFMMIGVAIAGVVTYPFSAGVTALLYVDLRMRREGLDLTLARAAAAQIAR